MTINIYALLAPLVFTFILLEIAVSWYHKKRFITFQEAVASFGVALGNQTLNVLVAAGIFRVYSWLWSNFRIIDNLEMNVITIAMLVLGLDFIFYWAHRWSHSINILWAAHCPHHSAEEMNFFVSLRASVTQRLFSFFFIWPLTIIGFKPIDIFTVTAFYVFMTFFHHTEVVGKLWRWVEYVFTTPSNHRVHHGLNFTYLDKNFGDFIVIWDRLFGTYREETEKVVYGMYNPPQSFNPITVSFHYFVVLWKDAMAAPHWIDKVKIWFMPPGWQPNGLRTKAALQEVTIQNQKRYQPVMLPRAKPYLLLQVIHGVVLMLFIMDSRSPWTFAERCVGTFMLWHAVINWSGILESKQWLYNSEVLRLIMTCLLFIFFFDHRLDHPASILYLLLCMGSLAWIRRFFLQEKRLPARLGTA